MISSLPGTLALSVPIAHKSTTGPIDISKTPSDILEKCIAFCITSNVSSEILTYFSPAFWFILYTSLASLVLDIVLSILSSISPHFFKISFESDSLTLYKVISLTVFKS